MSNLDMSEAIRMLAQEKGLSEDSLLHVLVDALASAYKRRPGAADEVVVEVDPQTMEFTFTAYDLDEDGNWVNERDDTPKREELGRIAAQTFRQVMSQRIREVERDRKFEEYANREGDIVTGIIQQTDTRYTLLDLGRVEALLPQAEQVPFERPQPGDRSKAYIVEVRKHRQGPADRRQPHPPRPDQAAVRARGARDRRRHRRDQGLRPRARAPHEDRRLVERPQRRPGRRVRRRPRRSCADGRQRAARREDRHRPVLATTSTTSSPRRCRRPRCRRSSSSDDGTQADVIVPDHQLSLAIGREGQNARLAARLTGVRIDIRSETQLAEGVPARREELEEGVEYAEGQWIQNADVGRDGVARRRRHRDERGRSGPRPPPTQQSPTPRSPATTPSSTRLKPTPPTRRPCRATPRTTIADDSTGDEPEAIADDSCR